MVAERGLLRRETRDAAVLAGPAERRPGQPALVLLLPADPPVRDRSAGARPRRAVPGPAAAEPLLLVLRLVGAAHDRHLRVRQRKNALPGDPSDAAAGHAGRAHRRGRGEPS